MFKKIFKEIKKFDNIVIARHIVVDPDAMASQVGLRDAIKETADKYNISKNKLYNMYKED